MTADADDSTESMCMGANTPSSGVGVLDKASVLLDALEMGPATVSVLTARSGFSQPTTYRLLRVLTTLGLVIPLEGKEFALGPRVIRLAIAARRDGQVPRTDRVQREPRDLCATGVGVLDRASVVLNALEMGPATPSALAARTSLSRSTTYRLLRALTTLGLVIPLERKKFALGPRVIRLAIAARRDGQVPRTDPVQRELHGLCAAPGIHTARLHQYHGPELICVAQATRRTSPADGIPLGADCPASGDPVARTALAWQKKGAHADPAQDSASALAHIWHQGWIQGTGECGGRSHIVLAVPVPGRGRCSAAVLSVYSRMPPTTNPGAVVFSERVVERVIQVAARLSDWRASGAAQST
ncbi:helix-turn-helix domain-containing protein [Streptomyces sp. 110]|uniref:Helix-turn-helix domain-containing protein n=1 Tax=Streptomyces endocoffeicus TaxID=2898945 RepID=A0ABS1PS68_9ACTN|nr:helix-turn-helix domain-containing protein [Streptomyces endocoffeicus]MBL1115281.1 helix-turn-helix domain-containing protein [Streptomyces endocoffeicus]